MPAGICMRQRDKYDRDALHFAPFVLFPSPFPREEFNKAIQLQTVLNELMHKVTFSSCDDKLEIYSVLASQLYFSVYCCRADLPLVGALKV
jgi:hypothetical protein